MNFPTKTTSDAPPITLPATLERTATTPVPAVIAAAGPKTAERFFTFFADNIRNRNTRAAYYRNACRFLGVSPKSAKTYASVLGAMSRGWPT